mmetsp:Transcript_42862/g.77006  ORF Transcript_42862/g.77006 Transcript_42862/m.77006 type:complete len:222 (-) Transcript_42862:626-1291(-)
MISRFHGLWKHALIALVGIMVIAMGVLLCSHKLSWGTVIPKNCAVWFDGCNQCFVKNGKLGLCTDLECDHQSSPKCMNVVVPPFKREDVPPGCSIWFNGCNSCILVDGRFGACTDKWCENLGTPRCTKFAENDFARIPLDCDVWFDGCNHCQVRHGELEMCTEMWCDQLETPECVRFVRKGLAGKLQLVWKGLKHLTKPVYSEEPYSYYEHDEFDDLGLAF